MSYTTLNERFEKVKDSDSLKALVREVPMVLDILYEAFADWEWMELPEDAPPFKPLSGGADLAYEKLLSQRTLRMIQIWKRKDVTTLKRESLFTQYLESLSYEEAKLLIAIKDKRVTEMFPTITRELVDETFPTLLVKPL